MWECICSRRVADCLMQCLWTHTPTIPIRIPNTLYLLAYDFDLFQNSRLGTNVTFKLKCKIKSKMWPLTDFSKMYRTQRRSAARGTGYISRSWALAWVIPKEFGFSRSVQLYPGGNQTSAFQNQSMNKNKEYMNTVGSLAS